MPGYNVTRMQTWQLIYYSFISMSISLTGLVNMCKIENVYFEMRLVGQINIHVQE